MYGWVYVIEIHQNNEWRILDLMTSLPGLAPKQVLDNVKEKHKHQVRVKRITKSEDFIMYILAGIPLAIHSSIVGCSLEFKDRILKARESDEGEKWKSK